MSDYTDSPACDLVATQCACCSRPLVDAVSVETGVGPECRKRHGYADAQGEPDWTAVAEALAAIRGTDIGTVEGKVLPLGPEGTEAAWRLGGIETRKSANVLVHRIAAQQEGPAVLQLVNAVRALGYTKLADRIAERLASVRIERVAGRIVVRAPYSPESVTAFRRVPGRKFEKDGRDARNTFPESSAKAVLGALRSCFPGATAIGPKGLFVLVAA